MVVLCRLRDYLHPLLLHQFQDACFELRTLVYVELLRVTQMSFIVNVLKHLSDLAGFLRRQRSNRLVSRGDVYYIQRVLVRVLVDKIVRQLQ